MIWFLEFEAGEKTEGSAHFPAGKFLPGDSPVRNNRAPKKISDRPKIPVALDLSETYLTGIA